MESLLPSEIARLVYGYLMEEKCDAAAQMFLETSEPLKECNLALKKGRKFSTRILGLSLLDILNIYTDAVCMLRNYKEKKALASDSTSEQRDSASLNIELNNVIQELESVLFAGEHPEKNTPKTIFVRISIPRNKKVSSSDHKSDKKETEKKEAERKEKEKENSQNQGGGDECFENTTVSKNVSSSLDDFDLNMLQTLLDNTALHERIAENINKAIDSSGEINTSETNEKKIVETVLHSTEADPIFEELLHMLAVPRAEDTTTPEDTDKEGGDPVEERPRPADQVTPQEQQVMKNIEAENTLAIEGILARNKTAQETGTVATDAQMNQDGEASIIHVTPPVMTSTPVQTMMAGVPTFVGILSPVHPRCTGQTLLVPLNTLPPDVLVGKRRTLPIRPKSDEMKRPVVKLQVQTPGSEKPEIIHAVPVVKARPPRPSKTTTDKAASVNPTPATSSVHEIVKIPRVRTRGGLHKGTSRGLKSISPQITQIGDDKIHVVLSENATGVKTRSMAKGPSQPKVDSVHNTLEVIPEENQVSEREEDRIPQQNAHLPISDLSSPQNQDSQSMSTLPNLLVETQSSLPVVETDKLSTDLKTSGSVKSTEDVCREQNMENPKIFTKGVMNSIGELVTKKLKGSPETELTDKENPTEKTTISVDMAPKITDGNGTPLQQANKTKVKKRVSLSTPRRGSHVRVLDFKTPDKKINQRKSLTSPKACSKSEKIDFMVEKAKRGILKSPEFKKSQGCDKNSPPEEGNAETGESVKFTPPKRDWDADLRKFMDIPTSVGLKRKNTTKKEPRKTMPKKKIVERKDTKNVKKKKENDSEPVLASDKFSSEDLVHQIEKEVREVICEEEISLTSIEESDNILKSNLMNSQSSNKSQMSSSAESMEIDEQTHCHETKADDTINKQDPTLKTGMDIADELVNPFEKKRVENISDGINPVIIDIADACNTVVADNLPPQGTTCCGDTSTPLKILSPNKEEVLGQITPTTKLILNQISLNNSPSYSNLESILISEGTRLEQENALRSVKSDITKLPDHFELESQKEDSSGSQNSNNKKISCNTEEIKRHIPVDCVLKQSVPQTPAKFLSAPLPLNLPVEATPAGKMTPGFQVEMTPLSKVLHSTTKFLSTKIVTPTLPTTPKPQDEKSPDKTDSLISITSDNENGNDKMHGKEIEDMHKVTTPDDQVIPINKHILKTTLSEESVNSTAGKNTSPKESESIATINSPSRPTKNKSKPKTPLVKLIPRKPKIVKLAIKKTIKKTNVRKISSSSESEEESIESRNVKSVDSNVKTSSPDQNSENVSVNSSLSEPIKKKNLSTPKPKQKCVEAAKNKKNKKMPSAKKQFDINLLKQEEEVLKECLQKAKAKALFGFISSESDSSEDNVSKISTVPPTPVTNTKISASKLHDPLKPELENAFHILKKIKSASMLVSSSSSEDDNDELDVLPPKRLAHNDSRKVKTPFKSDPPKSVPTPSQNISKTTSNITGQVIVSPGNKKLDSPKKIDRTSKEITKLISREKEESCESFPALYLSEESNISGISESHNAKFMKSRKSPSVGSDKLIFKKNVISSSGHLNPSLKSNVNKSNHSKLTLDPSKSVPSVKTKDVNEPLDVYESVHTTSTAPVVISGKESKALSEYLNNYSFTFTLDEENGVNTKTLRTSPFFTILEIDFTKNQQASRGRPKIRSPSHSPERNRVSRILSPRKACRERNVSPKKDQNIIRSPSPQREREGRKSSPQKGPHDRNLSPHRVHRDRLPSPHRDRDRGRNLSPQRDRHRKRPRSESSSSDDERRNYRRHQSNGRRDYWDGRIHFRRNKFLRKKPKFYAPRFQSSPYYREKFDSYRGPKFIPPESSSRSHKRSSNEHPDKSPSGFHTFEKHYSFNDSVRSSRSKESDRLLVDQSFEHSDSPLEKSRVYLTHSDTHHQRKANSKLEREDGELSDTSGFHTATTPDNVAEAKRKKPTSTVPDSSRANLLNKVDLDSFLTLLHGAEEEK